MSKLIFVLGDQLSHNLSSLKTLEKGDIVMLAEVKSEAEYVWHHKKKLVLIFSAMRHFAQELRAKNIKVEYFKLDEFNFKNFSEALIYQIKKSNPKKIIITEPSELRVLQEVELWKKDFDIDVEIQSDDRFIASHQDFQEYAKGKKSLLMEFFYRKMRLKTGLLMEKNKPIGGKWNYDSENRETMPRGLSIPEIPKIKPDKITLEVIKMVEEKFSKNFGEIENFYYAVDKKNAEILFEDFLKNRLKNFGKYQDAMSENFAFGFHSIIAPYMNIGLLDPLDVCKKVEEYYSQGKCPLNSAEGFIRQIIGWREYIRGIYWLKMPQYKELNFFNAKRKLPEFYWDESKTKMNCIKQVVKQTRVNAYSHHIQRLMVTGNFALLAAIDPDEINAWYMAVYMDAFEWVELPNTHGMAIFADGGIVASKPYAASGKYIDRMSDYCGKCAYSPKTLLENNSCPFNYLYWDFINRNKKLLEKNPRLKFAYANFRKKTEGELKRVSELAEGFLSKI